MARKPAPARTQGHEPVLYFDAWTRFGAKARQHAHQPWTLDHLVAEMKHCSISGALVAHSAQTTYDAMLENRRLIERIKAHDFLFPIWHAMPHWTGEFPEPRDFTRMMTDHNIRAVTLSPNTNTYVLTSRHTAPLLDALERAGALVIADYSEFPGRDLETILDRHPGLNILLRGITWSNGRVVVPLLLNHQNLHLGFDMFQSSYAIEWLTGKGCEDQLVFCSNATDMSMGAHRFYVDYADITQQQRAKIAGGNLTRLLRGLAPPREIVNKNDDFIMTEARRGVPLSPLVIDFHAHILDEGCNGAGGGYWMEKGGPRGVQALAKRMGVDAIGLMSWNGPVSVQADEGNQCVKDALDAAPKSWWGLGTFDVMHKTADEMKAQMIALYKDKRFLGLKPYPQYGIAYNDPRYDCWWEFGNARKLYAALHPVNWYQPGEFDSICSRFPDLTVVAYHCGASYDVADTVIKLANKFPNFHMEITLTPVCLGIIDYLVKHTSADRVLYGSDLPMRDPRQQLGWVVYSRLDVESKKKVLGGNAKRILEHVRKHQK